MQISAKHINTAHPNNIDLDCEHGLRVALKSFDTIDHESCVYTYFNYAQLYSTRLLVHYQIAQLRHLIIRPRGVQNGSLYKSAGQ